MPTDPIRTDVARYYNEKLKAHGPTPKGVDWNSKASQELRFEQLAKLLPKQNLNDSFSLLDYGCGFGEE